MLRVRSLTFIMCLEIVSFTFFSCKHKNEEGTKKKTAKVEFSIANSVDGSQTFANEGLQTSKVFDAETSEVLKTKKI